MYNRKLTFFVQNVNIYRAGREKGIEKGKGNEREKNFCGNLSPILSELANFTPILSETISLISLT